MSFERFVCWEPSRIQQVMNTEALQPRDDVFLATHHPVRMYRGNRLQDARIPYDQDTFRDDFLRPDGFAFVPVLGNAGTGKSHLVRWLWINIPRDEKRRVILIPRGGTNLRGVVELILRDMQGPAFDRYRDRLGNATNNLSLPQARHVLLDNLALAAGPDGAHGPTPDASADVREAQEHLAKYLPALLRDQFFRSHLLQENGIIDQLVRHVLGSADTVERRDARRQFSAGDLPLNVAEYQRAGADARQIFGELSTDSWLREVAIGWLNLHLEEAIGRLLQFGGADLTNLMRDVRADLALQGVELVLLIEDFARLQGIERQLLDALLEQPNQPDRRLCALRTALACTTDYFENVKDTVSQRTTFVVKLDREMSGEGAAVSPPEFQHFAARYLNAARLGEGVLEDWYDHRAEGLGTAPPNRCATCAFALECHAAFGARDGMGLYPFNADALGTMYARTAAQGFSPRLLISDVLRPTLEKYGDDLEHGTFPPPALLTGLGGPRISAADRTEITSRDPANAARREVLQEFWAGGRLVDLDPVLHGAFSRPPAGFGQAPAPAVRIAVPVFRDEPSRAEPEAPATPEGGMARRYEDAFLSLDRWQNGTELPQEATNVLRELVYEAVANRIDWSTEMLLRGEFTSSTGAHPFRQRSINFHNQETQHSRALVQLTLPVEGDSLTETALALQALMLRDHHGDWRFARGLGGARYQRVLARQVERWADEVLGQIRATYRPAPGWDPVPGAVEILALDARMAGGLPPLRPSIEELVDAVFTPLPAEVEGRAPEWTELVKILRRHRDALGKMVIARVGASKGIERARIVDAARLVPALNAIAAEWRPREPVPDDLPAPHFDALTRARAAVDRLLEPALREERERQLAAFDAVAAHLGGATHTAAADEVRAAMTRARDAGVFSGGNPEALERAIQAFRTSAFTAWAEHVGRIRAEAEPRSLIGLLSQDHGRAASAATAFVEAAGRFLAASTLRAESEVEQFTAGAGRDIDATLHAIDSRFDALDRALATIREENP
jgi:hypothetical protein